MLTNTCCIMAMTAAISACSTQAPSADRIELATIYPWNEVPQSTPRDLIIGFDTFCVKTKGTAAQEARLRNTGYVATNTTRGKARQLFLIDNDLPAIAISRDMCIARAVSRTGQTNAINRYVAEVFPEASPMNTNQLTVDVEQAWAVDGGILATARNDWIGNDAVYSVILFQPQGQDA